MHPRGISIVQRQYITALMLTVLLAMPGALSAQHHRVGTQRKPAASASFDRDALVTQVALDRAGFSPGEIDGHAGSKTRVAFDAYRASSRQPLDTSANPLTSYTITEQDAAGPFIDALPSDMMEEAKLPALGYTSLLEMLGERFHSSPALLKQLNPQAAWKAGESIQVPNVDPFTIPSGASRASAAAPPAASGEKPAPPSSRAADVVLTGATKSIEARDAQGKVIFHAPVTTGSEHDPLPIGEWKVNGVSWNPPFNYNPDLFWDAEPTHTKAKIAPGPNNPVGVVWIDINKEHYGIHGTPEPGSIGQTESHGCIRLTNWDAAHLATMVGPGTKLVFK